MSKTIHELTKEEAKTFHESAMVKNRVPADIMKKLTDEGWKIAYEFSIEKIYKGYYLVIEFCIGDFCVYPCSKNGHWLLEKKRQCDNFTEALGRAALLQIRIDAGEHWQGEED